MFPSSTIRFIETEVALLKESAGSVDGLVDGIYARVKSLEYGIEEALEDIEHFRFPNTIKKQANCAEAAVFVYLLAKYAGLNPQIVRIVNIDNRGPDHLSVIVPHPVHNDGYMAIDPFYNMKGSIEFFPDHLEVEGRIIDSSDPDFIVSECKSYSFSELEFLTEEGLLEHIMQLNSFDNFFTYIQGSQKIGTELVNDGLIEKFIAYNDEKNSLELTFAHKGVLGFYAVERLVFEFNKPETFRSEFYLADGFDWNRIIAPFFHATFESEHGSEKLVEVEPLPASQDQEEQILAHILYWSIDRPDKERMMVYSKEEHERVVERMPSIAESSICSQLQEFLSSESAVYLKEKFPRLYDLKIDLIVSLMFLDTGKDEHDIFEYARERIKNERGIKSSHELMKFAALDVRSRYTIPFVELFSGSSLMKLIGFYGSINSHMNGYERAGNQPATAQ